MSKPLFGELFIDHGESDRNAIHLYVSKPTPLEESSLGRVFTIVEFSDPEPYFQDIIDTIDATFTKGYYHSSDFDVEVAFERALHRVNRAVQDAVSQHGEGWTYRCNAVLGVIKHEEMHLSYVGKMEGLLAQGNDIIDILQISETDEVKPLKLFTSVVSGQVAPGTSVVLATSNLLDFMSLEKVRRFTHGNPPDVAAGEMEQVLTDNTTLSNITALIISQDDSMAQPSGIVGEENDVIDQALAEDGLEMEEVSNDSMDRLIHQERATEELLTPSIWPSLKKRMNSLADNLTNKPAPQQSNYVRSDNKVIAVLKMVWNFLATLFTQLVIGTLYVAKLIGQIVRRDGGSLASGRAGATGGSRGMTGGVQEWYMQLSPPRKVLLGVTIVVVGFFLFSLLFNGQASEEAAQEVNYDEVLTQVENLLAEAETKQVLGEDDAARSSVQDADDLLNSVPTDSEAYANRGDGLASRIVELNNTFNKVTTVQPTQLADLGGIEGFAGADAIEKIGDTVFAFSTQNGAVYKANLAADSISAVIAPDAAEANYVTVENDSVATTLAASQDGDFVQFSPVLEKTSPVNVAIAEEDLIVTDFDIFNDRIYILDGEEGQIYRHNASGDAYGSGTAWLNDGVNARGAVAMDIDSSIYTLMNDGTIRQFDGGDETEFTTAEFTPGMQGATTLFKDAPGNPFYVLNPTARTVIVLNEDGTLNAQYTADQFNDLKDMVVDEAAGKVYVLSGNSVYEIEIGS